MNNTNKTYEQFISLHIAYNFIIEKCFINNKIEIFF